MQWYSKQCSQSPQAGQTLLRDFPWVCVMGQPPSRLASLDAGQQLTRDEAGAASTGQMAEPQLYGPFLMAAPPACGHSGCDEASPGGTRRRLKGGSRPSGRRHVGVKTAARVPAFYTLGFATPPVIIRARDLREGAGPRARRDARLHPVPPHAGLTGVIGRGFIAACVRRHMGYVYREISPRSLSVG